ncbi:high affinity methionine permease [Diplodia corticola]|uniref:High affinity methionine permease n=1 Tax=Diplodia corticola TaxID=236234 RepID=A0A1J9R9K8_9PEZI|nr:high affinity methionine permease [Diplodia corticola]OJD36866.1 high affinity methionine permease [Diplodia corticola]
MVTALTGSKLIALALWIFGSIYSTCSILIYIEYGLAWPFNGGEFVYISKLFPSPPLLVETSFAWFFVSFSTSANNALMFARFCILLANKESEWLMKFVACVITIAISLLHYRLLSIGIAANNILATYKAGLLLVFVLAGLVAVCQEGAHRNLRGSSDFSSMYPDPSSSERSNWCYKEPASQDSKEGQVSGANVALAALLVLYSYQGWENSNYVASEIEGTPSQQRRVLKRGALLAVTVVSSLYILFNFLLFWLLSFGEIVESSSTTAAVAFAVRAFHQRESLAKTSIYVCIALSSCGNLIGVIFTNARVKRDIAIQRIIPFPIMFARSSTYGRNRGDMLGTPTGGLLLHALATCITIASVPDYGDGIHEGIMFVINLFTYGHAILQIILGIGLIFLKKRMEDNETHRHDPANSKGPYEEKWPWDYNILDRTWKRLTTGAIFILVNAFVVVMPLVPTTSLLDGCPRRIKIFYLPITVISILGFKQTKGPMEGDFVPHSARRVWWEEMSWRFQGKNEIMTRLRANYEKDTARELRMPSIDDRS